MKSEQRFVASRRWRLGAITLLVPLIFVGILGWLSWKNAAYERLNRELITAANDDDVARVGMLLAAGADVDTVVEIHSTTERYPLAWVVDLFRPPHHDPKAHTVFEESVINRRFAAAELLAERGAKRINSHTVFRDRTPLMAAIEAKSTRLLNVLVRRGADLNARDWIGTTAMMHATYQCRPDMVDALIAAGANVNAQDQVGRTALLAAAPGRSNAYRRIARHLLEHGANPRLGQSRYYTPLLAAARVGNASTVKLLVDHGAAAKPDDPDVRRALTAAQIRRYGDVIDLLERAGVRPTLPESDLTALRQEEAGNLEQITFVRAQERARKARELARSATKVTMSSVTTPGRTPAGP